MTRDGRIPVVIGVTGHRDLRPQDLSPLRERVRALFEELRLLCPSTPLVLLSPLAEGADRLVAAVALEVGCRLVVPLPLTREEYERDFGTEESRGEFADLLSRAVKVFVVEEAEGREPDGERTPAEQRNRRYALAGAWVSRHSQVVMALWDGAESDAEGGTAHTISFELKGIPEDYYIPRSILDPIESGAVYHVVTPRVANPEPAGEPFAVRKYFPEVAAGETWSEEAYNKLLKRLDTFNRDVVRFTQPDAASVAQSKEWVLSREVQNSVAEPEELLVLHHYAVADVLAIFFQARTRRALLGLLALGVLAFSLFEVYDELLPDVPVTLLLYPACLLAAYLWLFLARRRGYRNKYLDYRALAEGMRVQLFWNVVGLQDDAANHYLRKHSGEMEWIREALRGVNLLSWRSGEAISRWKRQDFVARCLIACESWSRDQAKFFARAKERDERKQRKLRLAASLLFGFGVAVAVVLFFVQAFIVPEIQDSLLHSIIIVTVSLSLAVAASLLAYGEKMALSEQAKQYHRMAELFGRAVDHLEALHRRGDLEGLFEVYRDLGKEALAENGDWVLLHRSRPLDLPVGG